MPATNSTTTKAECKSDDHNYIWLRSENFVHDNRKHDIFYCQKCLCIRIIHLNDPQYLHGVWT